MLRWVVGHWRLHKGFWRHIRYNQYYCWLKVPGLFGGLYRLHAWWYAMPTDKKPNYAFEAGQKIKVRGVKKLGYVENRWTYRNQRQYLVRIGAFNYVLIEKDMEHTTARIIADVSIKEVKFKRLADNLYTVPTERPTYAGYVSDYERGYHIGCYQNHCFRNGR